MYVNPRKTTAVRELGPVDVAALTERVLSLPESVWDAQNAAKPNRFEELAGTRHIVFRFVETSIDWRVSRTLGLWEDFAEVLEPVLAEASRGFGYARGQFPRIMLARMAPGAEIKPHRDANPAAKWPHKVHVPLTTIDQVTFFVEGIGYRFPVGHAFEVNNMGVHAVKNDGDTDRIHLIFEYYDIDQPAPEWVDQLRLEA